MWQAGSCQGHSLGKEPSVSISVITYRYNVQYTMTPNSRTKSCVLCRCTGDCWLSLGRVDAKKRRPGSGNTSALEGKSSRRCRLGEVGRTVMISRAQQSTVWKAQAVILGDRASSGHLLRNCNTNSGTESFGQHGTTNHAICRLYLRTIQSCTVAALCSRLSSPWLARATPSTPMAVTPRLRSVRGLQGLQGLPGGPTPRLASRFQALGTAYTNPTPIALTAGESARALALISGGWLPPKVEQPHLASALPHCMSERRGSDPYCASFPMQPFSFSSPPPTAQLQISAACMQPSISEPRRRYESLVVIAGLPASQLTSYSANPVPYSRVYVPSSLYAQHVPPLLSLTVLLSDPAPLYPVSKA